MAELINILKTHYNNIYKQSIRDGNGEDYDDREVNDYDFIEKVIINYVNDNKPINIKKMNSIISTLDMYHTEFIYMVLIQHGYIFTNMLVLIDFLSKISYALLYNKSSKLYKKILLETIFHPEIKKYIETNQEIIITDKDIEGLLSKTLYKGNIELVTNIIFQQISNLSCLNYDKLVKRKINWDVFIKDENEIIKITKNDESKEKIKEYLKIVKTYIETEYFVIKFPTFVFKLEKYKKEYEKVLSNGTFDYSC
jgi:hypothetical protein